MHKFFTALNKDHIRLNEILILLQAKGNASLSGNPSDFFMIIDIVDYINHHPRKSILHKGFLEQSDENTHVAESLPHSQKNLPLSTLDIQGLIESIVDTDTALDHY